MTCKNCKQDAPFCKGLCRNCYMYQYRHGEPRPTGDLVRKVTVEDVHQWYMWIMEGQTLTEISKKSGFWPSTITNNLAGKTEVGRQARVGTWGSLIDKALSHRRTVRRGKFLPKDVVKIRQMHDDGKTRAEIAEDFSVNTETIARLLRGESYQAIE